MGLNGLMLGAEGQRGHLWIEDHIFPLIVGVKGMLTMKINVIGVKHSEAFSQI